RAESLPLPIVDNRDGDLGHVGTLWVADVPRYPDPFSGLLVEGGERLVVVMVDLGQIAHHRLAQFGPRGKEPSIAGLGAQAREAAQQQLLVRSVTLAQANARTVAQDDRRTKRDELTRRGSRRHPWTPSRQLPALTLLGSAPRSDSSRRLSGLPWFRPALLYGSADRRKRRLSLHPEEPPTRIRRGAQMPPAPARTSRLRKPSARSARPARGTPQAVPPASWHADRGTHGTSDRRDLPIVTGQVGRAH